MDTTIKSLHELGINVKKGIIPLIGEVGEEMYGHLVMALNTLENAGLEFEELTVLLSTYGGELYHAFGIYDLLKSRPERIRIVCNGPVMSAGTIILMAGDVREMTPLSYLMVHYGFDMQESQSALNQNTHLLDTMKRLYKENSNATARQIAGWFNADTYFTADKALKLGLIDKVNNYEEKSKRKKSRATRIRK